MNGKKSEHVTFTAREVPAATKTELLERAPECRTTEHPPLPPSESQRATIRRASLTLDPPNEDILSEDPGPGEQPPIVDRPSKPHTNNEENYTARRAEEVLADLGHPRLSQFKSEDTRPHDSAPVNMSLPRLNPDSTRRQDYLPHTFPSAAQGRAASSGGQRTRDLQVFASPQALGSLHPGRASKVQNPTQSGAQRRTSQKHTSPGRTESSDDPFRVDPGQGSVNEGNRLRPIREWDLPHPPAPKKRGLHGSFTNANLPMESPSHPPTLHARHPPSQSPDPFPAGQIPHSGSWSGPQTSSASYMDILQGGNQDDKTFRMVSSPQYLSPIASRGELSASPDEIESPSSSAAGDPLPPRKRRRYRVISQRSQLNLEDLLQDSDARRSIRRDLTQAQGRQTPVTPGSSSFQGDSPSPSESEDPIDPTPPPSSLTASNSNSPPASSSNTETILVPDTPVPSPLKRAHSPLATASRNKRVKGEGGPSVFQRVLSSAQTLLKMPFSSRRDARQSSPRSSSLAAGRNPPPSALQRTSTSSKSPCISAEDSLGNRPPTIAGNLTKQDIVEILQDHEAKIGLRLDAAVSGLEAVVSQKLDFLLKSWPSEPGSTASRERSAASAQSDSFRALAPSNPAHVGLSSSTHAAALPAGNTESSALVDSHSRQSASHRVANPADIRPARWRIVWGFSPMRSRRIVPPKHCGAGVTTCAVDSVQFENFLPSFEPSAGCKECWIPCVKTPPHFPATNHSAAGARCIHPRAFKQIAWTVFYTPSLWDEFSIELRKLQPPNRFPAPDIGWNLECWARGVLATSPPQKFEHNAFISSEERRLGEIPSYAAYSPTSPGDSLPLDGYMKGDDNIK
ncbi:hypothetical protein FB451DRAFT_1378589 [Mycena latifolia]|nr:hypothetical protein FB451DRAFT_1378589 [Mycena latifolia]